ncbi:hypothetical protein BDV09DRAFT_190793 [Aspergillus tetrazonus]
MEPTPIAEDSPAHDTPNDRALLVKGLQDSAAAAIEYLHTSALPAQTWSLPAKVFPESVLILASCIVSGKEDGVRTIKLNIEIPGVNRPQSSLNALLEYCSVLGRRAFEQSCEGMLRISSLAISAGKKVERIMRLVGRSDRRALLYAELSAFQGLTSDLTKHVDAIGTAFKEWSDFTDNLRVHLGDELGVDPTEDLSNDDLKLAQDIFERAEQKLDKAQAQYQDQDRKLAELLTREIPRVCSPAEILEKLSEIIPQDSDKWPGLRRIWRAFWSGEKRTERAFDERLKMHMQSLTEAIKISSAEAEREQIAVREQTEVVSVKIKKAEADLDVAKQEYAEASENLIRVSRRVSQQNLRLLGGNKLDLKAIQQILSKSAQQLRILRQRISTLATMFTDLSNLIENTIHNYENFQRGLQLGQRYIRPGLDDMENFSRTDLELYKRQHQKLESWCTKSVQEIEQLTLEGHISPFPFHWVMGSSEKKKFPAGTCIVRRLPYTKQY